MKKIALSLVITSFALIIIGCEPHKRFMVENPGPELFEQMTPSAATEVGLAESVAEKRLEYIKELEKIKSYYEQSGNQLKIEWVNRELKFLDEAPRYRYIIEAEVAGSDLRAKDIIPKATSLYSEGLQRYKSCDIIPIPGSRILTGKVLVSRERLQIALNKFNDVIKDYPTSDKIDDAAYYAGRIHEFFGDYSIAVLYYKRAFQWDPATPYPARYRAAVLLDYQFAQRDQAMQLYRESLDKETQTTNSAEIWQRIKQLSGEPNSTPIE